MRNSRSIFSNFYLISKRVPNFFSIEITLIFTLFRNECQSVFRNYTKWKILIDFFLFLFYFETNFFDRNYTMDRSKIRAKEQFSSIFSYFYFISKQMSNFFDRSTIRAIEKFSSIFSHFWLISKRVSFRSKIVGIEIWTFESRRASSRAQRSAHEYSPDPGS